MQIYLDGEGNRTFRFLSCILVPSNYPFNLGRRMLNS